MPFRFEYREFKMPVEHFILNTYLLVSLISESWLSKNWAAKFKEMR